MTADPARPAARRPRQRLTEEQRRTQILEATVAIVAAHGYDQASLARIAEHAGVSKGLVSHYFGSREDLMAQTATATVRAVREAIGAALDLTAPVPEVIRGAIHHAARLHLTHRAALAALTQITSNLRAPDGTRRLSLVDYEETRLAQEALFRRGQAEGSLRDLDPRLMAVTYQGSVDTMLAYAEAYPDTDLDHYADTLADLFLRGVEAPTR